MIEAEFFCKELYRRRIRFFSGVPCSFFGGPISLLPQGPGRYVAASNEGSALAMASGAELAGVRSAVLLQNSGFGNLLNPLTSLVQTFHIPTLVFMSLRGWPDPDADEPQHAVMGRSTHRLLESVGVHAQTLGSSASDLVTAIDTAEDHIRRGKPSFILVPKGAIGNAVRDRLPASQDGVFDRRRAVETVAEHLGDAVVYGTTGLISRELYRAADRPRNFYMQGSMGHALSLGLGTALARPDLPVMVVDGDGSALMHLGSAVTAGALAPARLTHVVLDNGCYASTGAQPTMSTLSWADFGAAAGYRATRVCDSAAALHEAMTAVRSGRGPSLVVARISPDAEGVRPPARVTSAQSPAELRTTFMNALRG